MFDSIKKKLWNKFKFRSLFRRNSIKLTMANNSNFWKKWVNIYETISIKTLIENMFSISNIISTTELKVFAKYILETFNKVIENSTRMTNFSPKSRPYISAKTKKKRQKSWKLMYCSFTKLKCLQILII